MAERINCSSGNMTRAKAKEGPKEKQSLDNDDCLESSHLSDDEVAPEDDCKQGGDSLFGPPDTYMTVSHEIDVSTTPNSATKMTKTPAVKQDDTKPAKVPSRPRPVYPNLFIPRRGPVRYNPNVPSSTSKLKLSPANFISTDSSTPGDGAPKSILVTGDEAARLAEVTRATYKTKTGGDGRVSKLSKEMTQATRRAREQRKRWAKLPKVMRR